MRALTAAIGEVHTEAMKWLTPRLSVLASKTDADTPLSSEWMTLVTKLSNQLASRTEKPFEKMATALANDNGRAMKGLGLDVRGQLGPQIAQMQQVNQSLMVKAGRSYATDVAELLNDPANWGKPIEQLTALLQERAQVSESRAQLIARDQTSKTAGSINQFRQRQAGVASYTWSGSLDERERETHVAHEGQTFRWDDPPADTGHPTEDIQCRCIAIPEIDFGDETAPDDTSSDESAPP